MSPISLDPATLAAFGTRWAANGGASSRTPPSSSVQLGDVIDTSEEGPAALVAPLVTLVMPARTGVFAA